MTKTRTRRKKAKAAEPLDTRIPVVVHLEADVHDALAGQLEGRGSTIEKFFQVAARGYLRRPQNYELQTKLGFGKYYGEQLETIIRLDPRYIRWCIGNLAGGFVMSEMAHDLLEKVDPVVQSRRGR